MNDYQKVIATLRTSYNQEKAKQRNQSRKEDWKIAERQQLEDNPWHFQLMILHPKG